ncbi:PREDICTED: farnesyl pyrophosphate synthase isoform X3 [Miniopterus natalensis]|uniref:farnesyl pyrophosphate synthase isoform X3 n=1 Tax=Miniopterus natalensis TaxID=291302 RepID=UPI0007A6C40A|nr:PREDICTED: farnesyl pyrophosphate synthase isoform X3 [Miniopterus natalensis]
MMPPSRWLRSMGVFLLPVPCWVPLERWLGPLRQLSLVHRGSVLGAWHSARCWCQVWTEEPRVLYSSHRMNGDQKLDVYDQKKQNFMQHFSQIIKVLTEDDTGYPDAGDAIARLKEVLEYNVIGGKHQRGMTVLTTFQDLVEPAKQDAESLQRAMIVGWCVELLQAFFLVADDIMDSSLTRRGQICWYKKPGVGLNAVNDVLLLEACIFRLLKLYCREQPYYLNLMELFLQAGIDGEKEHTNAKKILLEIGELFQIQDDYLDLFGDPSVTGKIGTDIQDNKCSWLVVQCLQRASPEQRQILQENYGQKDAEKVARVKALYEELNLQAVFLQYEEESYRHLLDLIERYSSPLPPAIFLRLAHKIYKRKK